eukprot:4631201-Pleurochrysis_carterae.AAC.1
MHTREPIAVARPRTYVRELTCAPARTFILTSVRFRYACNLHVRAKALTDACTLGLLTGGQANVAETALACTGACQPPEPEQAGCTLLC